MIYDTRFANPVSRLTRAERLPVGESCQLPVLQIEDLIGLKIQAATNDLERAPGDQGDVGRLLIHAAETGWPLDWALLEDYLVIFDCEAKLAELKALHERYLCRRKNAVAGRRETRWRC